MSIMNTKNDEMVKLTCENCGFRTIERRYCPYTGHEKGKGWNYVCPDCKDYLVMEKVEVKPGPKYRIQCYIPIELGGDEPVFDGLEPCLKEIEHLRTLQPENIYYAEMIMEDEDER